MASFAHQVTTRHGIPDPIHLMNLTSLNYTFEHLSN
jgi:hypothetical protein